MCPPDVAIPNPDTAAPSSAGTVAFQFQEWYSSKVTSNTRKLQIETLYFTINNSQPKTVCMTEQQKLREFPTLLPLS